MAENTKTDELRGKIVRCFLNDAKGAVITPGVLENIVSLIKQEAERHADTVIGEDAFIDYSQKELYGDGQIATLENENNLRKYQRQFNHYPLKEKK